MNYIDELYHSTGPWKKHKYILKKSIKGKMRYYYPGDKLPSGDSSGEWHVETALSDLVDKGKEKIDALSKMSVGTYNDGTFKRVYINLDDEQYSDKVGFEVCVAKGKEYVGLFNTKDSTFWDNNEDVSKLNKKKGRLSKEYAEDGVAYKLDLSKKSSSKTKPHSRPKTVSANKR